MRSKKQVGILVWIMTLSAIMLLVAACSDGADSTAAVESVAATDLPSIEPQVETPTSALAPTIVGIVPTVIPSPTPTDLPTATPTAAATATVQPTTTSEPTITSSPTPTLAPDQPTPTPQPVDRSTLRTQIKFTQNKLRDLVFLLNQADQFGMLDCKMFTFNYEELRDGAQLYYADKPLVIAGDFYERALVQGLFAFEQVYQVCEENGKDEVISAEFPTLLLLDAKEQGAVIMADINDALLWVNGDNLIAHDVYTTMQITLARYTNQLAPGTTDRCEEIHALYQEIIAAPQFSPPIGYRLDAYFNYLDALTFIEQGSLQIDLLCSEHLTRGTDDAEALPLQPDALRVANWTARRAQTAIELALDLLPESEPLPAPVPVYGEVVSTGKVDDDTFEVVLRVYVRVGTPPFSAIVNGFAMQPNGRVTVQHSCGTDFNGSILVTDVNGEQFESEVITVSQAESCQ